MGRLPDARYAALDAQYAKEQEELSSEISELEKAISNYNQGKKSAEKFIALIDKYQGFETMTNTMLNEFVEKILVHERDRKGSQDTTQTVEIYFNFVGKYIPPVFREVQLTPEEQEVLRKKEEIRDAILFIRGAKPVLDLKYELMDHPAIHHTADGGGPPYIHHQTKPETWLPGAALFAPEDADDKKEEPKHEQSEEE